MDGDELIDIVFGEEGVDCAESFGGAKEQQNSGNVVTNAKNKNDNYCHG